MKRYDQETLNTTYDLESWVIGIMLILFVQFRTIPWGRDLKTDLTNPRGRETKDFHSFLIKHL